MPERPTPTRLLPARDRAPPDPVVPWWRVGVMWLVVGGPGVVVIASFALLATAVRQADTVVPHAGGRSVGKSMPSAPALQARNHLTTPPAVRALDTPAASSP